MHDLDCLTRHTLDSTAAESTTTEPVSAWWSREQFRELGVTTDLMSAARMLGIGRTKAYQLAREGRFPVALVRVGRNYRVVVARLIELFGLDEEPRG